MFLRKNCWYWTRFIKVITYVWQRSGFFYLRTMCKRCWLVLLC